MLEPAPNPAALPAPASYHWTPALQAEFLGHLAAMASVRGAALFVQMSPRAAYDLRNRRDGLAFKLGWAAAILIARDRLQDELLDRAMTGTEDVYERIPLGEPGAWQVRRRRINAPASMAMLERLDRIVAEQANTHEDRLARIIAADFACYLGLFTTEAFAADPDAALAAWFADQHSRPDPLAALFASPPIPCEVAQICANVGEEMEQECTPKQAATELSVWYDDDEDQWLTDFPPPDDFDGEENGDFGDDGYWRTLDDAEMARVEQDEAAELDAFRFAAEARRTAWLGMAEANTA